MAGVGIAAGVAAAATVASAAVSASGALSGGGGSTSSQPTKYQQVPQDALTQAQRSYWDRLAVANANKTYPSFAAYTESGGDPSKATFNLTMPGLTPQEMTAFGFTGPQGQMVPQTPYAQAAGGAGAGQQLTQQQEMFLGKQRLKSAMQQGATGPTTPLQRLGAVGTRLGNVTQRLAGMGPADIPTTGATAQQGRLQDRLQARQANLQNRVNNLQQKVQNM